MKKLIASIAIAFIFVPCLASAVSNIIQAENFTQSHNIAPEEIATGTGVLVGLDAAGEWVEFQLFTSEFGTYSVTMKCWGTLNVPYKFNLVTVPPEGQSSQTIQLNFTGKGSCGS